jgi:hypothetical protein
VIAHFRFLLCARFDTNVFAQAKRGAGCLCNATSQIGSDNERPILQFISEVPIMTGTSVGTEMAHAKDQVSIADGQITLYRRDDITDPTWRCQIKTTSHIKRPCVKNV